MLNKETNLKLIFYVPFQTLQKISLANKAYFLNKFYFFL